jgi:hypothetical protein
MSARPHARRLARTAAVALAVVALAPAIGRAADGGCRWVDPGKKPRVFVDDRVVNLRAYYDNDWARCVMAAGAKEVVVEWLVGDDPGAAPAKTEKVQLYAGKGEGPRTLDARLFPGAACEPQRARGTIGKPTGALTMTGRPGREQVAALVRVQARVAAAGPLAPLAFTAPPVEIPCAACQGKSGRLWVQEDPDAHDTLVLEGEADPAWFACAAHGAGLSLLGFGGASRAEVTDAIRPDFVLAGLEKGWSRKDDKLVLRRPLPTAKLCAGAKVWSFEVWGRGELMSIGGGGRDLHELRCR